MTIERKQIDELTAQQKKEIFEMCLRNNFHIADIWGLLYKQGYRPLLKRMGLTNEQIIEFDKHLNIRYMKYFVTLFIKIEDEKIVGFSVFESPNCPHINPNTKCFMSYVFILPNFRRRGIGSELIMEVIELFNYAREMTKLLFGKNYKLQIEVEKNDLQLIEYYERFEFKNTHKTKQIFEKMYVIMVIN